MTTLDADIRAIQQAILKLTRFEREELAEWILNSGDFVDQVGEAAPAYGANQHLTVEEYLDLPEGLVRYEYVAGQIFAMSSPLIRHQVIVSNLTDHFHSHLRGGPCRVFTAQTKVRLRIDQDDLFYIPDVVIACGPLSEQLLEQQYLTQPRVVVEVLSRSTEAIDRREKVINYRQLESLEEFVLIAQRSMEVTLFRRADNWLPQVLTGPDEVLRLQSVELAVSLREIYEDAR